jgi:hypothetical protein
MKKIRTVENQRILETKTHLMIHIRTPYWSAYKRYGWTDKVEGFGLSKKLVELAEKLNKKIMIVCRGKHEITPKKINRIVDEYASHYMTMNSVLIFVIPRDKCKKIVEVREPDPISINNTFLKMNDKKKDKFLKGIRKAINKNE